MNQNNKEKNRTPIAAFLNREWVPMVGFLKQMRCLLILFPTMMVCISGCDQLPAYEKIDKLRVLAVRAAQPQIRIGETAVIDALVVTPDSAPVTLTWQACLYTLDADHKRGCPINGVIAQGQGEMFQFTVAPQFASEMMRICNRDPLLLQSLPTFTDLPECDEPGFPMSVRMVATSANETVITRKRVWVTNESTLPFAANPTIDGYSGLPTTLTPNEAYSFEIIASPGYIPPDPKEAEWAEIRYSWFVLGGNFNYMSEHYNDDLAPEKVFLKAKDSDRVVQMWIVVRDEYGGVDWQELQFTVLSSP